MCKPCLGVQLLQNPPLCSSTYLTHAFCAGVESEAPDCAASGPGLNRQQWAQHTATPPLHPAQQQRRRQQHRLPPPKAKNIFRNAQNVGRGHSGRAGCQMIFLFNVLIFIYVNGIFNLANISIGGNTQNLFDNIFSIYKFCSQFNENVVGIVRAQKKKRAGIAWCFKPYQFCTLQSYIYAGCTLPFLGFLRCLKGQQREMVFKLNLSHIVQIERN